jgi:hypothetical protein
MPTCDIREQLLKRYIELLQLYTVQLHQLAKSIPFDQAQLQTRGPREECLTARNAVRAHEGTHGCMGGNGLGSHSMI